MSLSVCVLPIYLALCSGLFSSLGVDANYVSFLRVQSVNQIAVDFIKEKEGCRTTAYQDSGGTWTIGYGHTGPSVVEGLQWSQAECEATLARDVTIKHDEVKKLVTVPLNDNQMAALTSFAYNLGSGALKKSLLLVYVNGKQFLKTPTAFTAWSHIKEEPSKGLLKRRLEEARMFLDYEG